MTGLLAVEFWLLKLSIIEHRTKSCYIPGANNKGTDTKHTDLQTFVHNNCVPGSGKTLHMNLSAW